MFDALKVENNSIKKIIGCLDPRREIYKKKYKTFCKIKKMDLL